jgi:hypothetical protein
MAIILKANKVNLFVSSVLFVFWYHLPNILDTLHICNISWLRVKHCAANRKRRLSALPNVGPYIYTTLKFLALQGAPHIYIYDISRLRVKKTRCLGI